MEFEPGNPSVLNAYAVLTGVFGRRTEQIALYEDALERDPVAMSVLWNLAGAYMGAGRYDDAAALIERMRRVSPESAFVTVSGSFLHWFRGEAEAALDGFQAAGGLLGDFGSALSLYDLGQDEELEKVIERLTADGENSALVAIVFTHMGRHDAAFEWLDRAYETRDDEMMEIRMYVGLDPLHDDPRWEALLRKIGISDADGERIGI
jgi:tetratricopeptide (TPR) repeat protein